MELMAVTATERVKYKRGEADCSRLFHDSVLGGCFADLLDLGTRGKLRSDLLQPKERGTRTTGMVTHVRQVS